MSRLTPFDVAFAALVPQFDAIRREALEPQSDLADRAQFAKLPGVQRFLAEVASPDAIADTPEAAAEYLAGIYAAFRFWAAGRRVLPVDRAGLLRALHEPAPSRLPPVPEGACYLQMPERWFWARIDDQSPHEPLDGAFVTASGPHGEHTVVAVLGLRTDRPGYSQLAVWATPSEFLAARHAVRSPPFAPVLEGGNAAGLQSLVSVAELLHLVLLALAQAAE